MYNNIHKLNSNLTFLHRRMFLCNKRVNTFRRSYKIYLLTFIDSSKCVNLFNTQKHMSVHNEILLFNLFYHFIKRVANRFFFNFFAGFSKLPGSYNYIF